MAGITQLVPNFVTRWHCVLHYIYNNELGSISRRLMKILFIEIDIQIDIYKSYLISSDGPNNQRCYNSYLSNCNLSLALISCWWLIWPIQNDIKKTEKLLKPWHMGTHLRVLSQSYLMNNNMTGFRWFSKIVASLCFGPK